VPTLDLANQQRRSILNAAHCLEKEDKTGTFFLPVKFTPNNKKKNEAK